MTGDDCAFFDGEAEVFTYGENRVIVSLKTEDRRGVLILFGTA